MSNPGSWLPACRVGPRDFKRLWGFSFIRRLLCYYRVIEYQTFITRDPGKATDLLGFSSFDGGVSLPCAGHPRDVTGDLRSPDRI
ncbi:hypothetical protein HGG75_10630 [Ochrobactrum pseudogrignonense]|nr:hypothetical protein [Brucella pseudogrignonensis]